MCVSVCKAACLYQTPKNKRRRRRKTSSTWESISCSCRRSSLLPEPSILCSSTREKCSMHLIDSFSCRVRITSWSKHTTWMLTCKSRLLTAWRVCAVYMIQAPCFWRSKTNQCTFQPCANRTQHINRAVIFVSMTKGCYRKNVCFVWPQKCSSKGLTTLWCFL